MLSNPMAVAARSPGSPGSSASASLRAKRDAQADAPSPRVPCPLCGGAIHPVAGRCKHCKQDLTSHRGRGAAAGARLGDGNVFAAPAPARPPVRRGGAGPGHGAPPSPSLPPSPSSLPTLPSLSPGVAAVGLPAYPSDLEPRPRRGWLHNWPLVVMTLAVIGMIVALILLVMPQHDGGARRGKRLPGNDNMETDVLPRSGKAGAVDPWAPSPRSQAAPDPAPPSRPAPPAPPPDDADSDDSDDADSDDAAATAPDDGAASGDPFGDVLGGQAAPAPEPDDVVTPDEIDPAQLGGSFDPLDASADPSRLLGRDALPVSLMAAHTCARAASCAGRRSRLAACAKLVRPRQAPSSARCQNPVMLLTCLHQIDALPCDAPPSMDLVERIPACLHVLAC